MARKDGGPPKDGVYHSYAEFVKAYFPDLYERMEDMLSPDDGEEDGDEAEGLE